MSTPRLAKRTPGCVAVSTAILSGHTLRFHKKSKYGSGKCDAYHTGNADDVVHGVLFDIPTGEKADLDNAEGLNNGYVEKVVSVRLPDGSVTEALIYVASADAIDAGQKPTKEYKQHVLNGASEHGLPRDYVETYISTVVTID